MYSTQYVLIRCLSTQVNGCCVAIEHAPPFTFVKATHDASSVKSGESTFHDNKLRRSVFCSVPTRNNV